MLDARYSIKNSRNWIKVFEIINRNSEFQNPKYLNPDHPVRSLDPDSVGINPVKKYLHMVSFDTIYC